VTYVITNACVDVMDKSCVRECPVDCIYQGDRSMYINPDECIDCGACVMTCPMDAIAYEFDLSDEDKPFLDRAAEFFAEIGTPGGARRHGPIGHDHPAVAALPPQLRE
jgi:NAD-dependent dihydropyrimidine dehydrogenase PreA subunit